MHSFKYFKSGELEKVDELLYGQRRDDAAKNNLIDELLKLVTRKKCLSEFIDDITPLLEEEKMDKYEPQQPSSPQSLPRQMESDDSSSPQHSPSPSSSIESYIAQIEFPLSEAESLSVPQKSETEECADVKYSNTPPIIH